MSADPTDTEEVLEALPDLEPALRPKTEGYEKHELPHLDEMERKVLQLMSPRADYAAVGATLGVSEAIVRRICHRLSKKGVLHLVRTGRPVRLTETSLAIVHILVEPKRLEEVAAKISAYEEVKYVAVATGGPRIIAQTEFGSRGKLAEFLTHTAATIEGVLHTNTSHILSVHKRSLDSGFLKGS